MVIDYLIILFLGMGAAIVGALPFGLVNLTVLNVTFERGNRAAIKIAHGAALVEVVFGLTALFAGGMLARHIEGNAIVSYTTAGVLIIGGVFFVSGIWLGKMAVLWMYMNLSNRILSRSRIISKNINTIIGIMLFGLAFVQVLKI
jgi:threonine/homoserine/homoserine lactone efflux protein